MFMLNLLQDGLAISVHVEFSVKGLCTVSSIFASAAPCVISFSDFCKFVYNSLWLIEQQYSGTEYKNRKNFINPDETFQHM